MDFHCVMPDLRILLEELLLSAVGVDETAFLIYNQNLVVYHTELMAMLTEIHLLY